MNGRLIVLNGPPASGKSTLAERLAAQTPGALWIDVDHIKELIEDWSGEPSGLLARDVTTAMATDALAHGDVVMSQMFAQAAGLDQVRSVASAIGSETLELMLTPDRDECHRRFIDRGGPKAAQLQSMGSHAFDQFCDQLELLAADRPQTVTIDAQASLAVVFDRIERACRRR